MIALSRVVSKKVSLMTLAIALISLTIISTDSVGAASGAVKPQMYCTIYYGTEICGSAAYIDQVEAAGSSAITSVSNNKNTVEHDLCYTVATITGALGYLLTFLPETTIILLISDALGYVVTPTELAYCTWN